MRDDRSLVELPSSGTSADGIPSDDDDHFLGFPSWTLVDTEFHLPRRSPAELHAAQDVEIPEQTPGNI